MRENVNILSETLVGGALRVHLIGVAGSGMSGLAALLQALGHRVSGSDRVTTIEVERLQRLGLEFHQPQAAGNVHGADLVIFSSAIHPGNAEYDEAVGLGIKMVRRADALAAIMECKKGVIVAGMHGKTTTSSMAAHVLRAGGLHPSHYVGAEIPILGANAQWDAGGDWFVAEGDESDGTLANYRVEHAIILNIEEEHLDYYPNLSAIEVVFNALMDRTRGIVFFCADDPNAARLCGQRPRAVSFGAAANADYRFENLRITDFQSRFEVFRRNERLGEVVLNVPGRHNVSNSLSVIALASELGVEFDKIASALLSFRGARRRFEIKYRSERWLVVDDYAHHPSEIRATLATARGGGSINRVFVMFQPHRYTRTLALKEEFGRAFDDADFVFLADVYPASEAPIPGVSGRTIADALEAHGHRGVHYIPERARMVLDLGRMLEPGDCVLSLGAGNIHEHGSILSRDLAQMDKMQAIMGEGVIKLYEPLAKHTTLRVGGPAQFWAEPETEEAFARLVGHCNLNGIPLMVIGRGSNLVVRDGGIRGVVVHLDRGEFRRLAIDGVSITAGAGVKYKELAMAAKAAAIGDFEWMEGIPGSVGGGLRMNAGAMGGETFRQVRSLRLVDTEGRIHTRLPGELDVRYRGVSTLAKQYATLAVFEGRSGEIEEINRLINDFMHKRWAVQPKEPSSGCTFKNPQACPAGQLIEELGLKNARIGGARVSELHGNFIVNDRGATAADMLALIHQIRAAARTQRGIDLETEVQIVGDDHSII